MSTHVQPVSLLARISALPGSADRSRSDSSECQSLGPPRRQLHLCAIDGGLADVVREWAALQPDTEVANSDVFIYNANADTHYAFSNGVPDGFAETCKP
jgi:hypothetical protein